MWVWPSGARGTWHCRLALYSGVLGRRERYCLLASCAMQGMRMRTGTGGVASRNGAARLRHLCRIGSPPFPARCSAGTLDWPGRGALANSVRWLPRPCGLGFVAMGHGQTRPTESQALLGGTPATNLTRLFKVLFGAWTESPLSLNSKTTNFQWLGLSISL